MSETAVDISDAYEPSTIISATLVVSTEMARVPQLALSILVARQRTNVKLIPVCYKDTYISSASLCQLVLHVPYLSLPQIAIDSAIFPEGTTGLQLDVLARPALWKDGLSYLVCISPCSLTLS